MSSAPTTRPPGPAEAADGARPIASCCWPCGPGPRPGRAGSGDRSEGDPHARLLARLEPSWARRCATRRGGTTGAGDRAEARERLREAHRTEARVDPGAGPSELVARGLHEESPAVRRAVVAAAPGPIRSRVQAELLLDNDDLRAERPADPEVLAWACALWTERLVGGEPRKADDPPVIVAMAGLSPRDGYRLCRYAGEIKLALAGQRRAEWACDFAATAGPEFAAIARHDVRSPRPAAKLPRDGCRPGSGC